MNAGLDASLFHFLYGRFQDSRWLPFMRQVTHLGDSSVAMALTLLGWVETVRTRQRIRRAGAAAAAQQRPPLLSWLGVPLAHWLTSGLKLVFGRPRPFEQYPLLGLDPAQMGSAFPSGHATAAFALATALGYRWPRGRPLWFTLAGLVALSRVALGVHRPWDVVAGAAVGFFVVFGLARLERFSDRIWFCQKGG